MMTYNELKLKVVEDDRLCDPDEVDKMQMTFEGLFIPGTDDGTLITPDVCICIEKDGSLTAMVRNPWEEEWEFTANFTDYASLVIWVYEF